MSELLHDRKSEILEEVLNRLLEGASLTVIELVDELSISRKTLYNYFSNREELLAQVTELYFDRLENTIARIINSEKSCHDRGRELFAILPKTVQQVELLSRHRAKDIDFMRSFNFRSYSRLKALITEYMEEGQRSGIIKSGIVAHRVADLFFTLLKGNVYFGDQLSCDSAEQRFHDYTRIIIVGLFNSKFTL